MHAFCLEWLADSLLPGNKVLDVGSGSGYLCAAFYEMMDL
jgi:protein-L-isoaspartate(D-aspartate) O-methyltransferase